MEFRPLSPSLQPKEQEPVGEEPIPKKQKMSTTSATSDDDEFDAATGVDGTQEGPKPERKPKYKRRKIAIFFAYCGVGYQGMQKNPGAKTIEGDLEEALFHAGAVPEHDRGCPRRYDWARSARTDKGVSAVGQVVSGRFYVDPPGLVDRLNSILPPQIRIFGYKRVTKSFSSKKFCDRRRYVYLIPLFALDPSCHRDRESVLASLGSGNELVKCLECSERGRKVFGVMGKRNFDSGASSGVISVESGILSNSGDAESNSEMKEGGQEASHSSANSNHINDNGNESKESVEELENGTSELAKNEGENQNGEVKVMKSEFCYGDKERERFNRILKTYEGTHNFHNFTTRTKAEDPAAKRYIISFEAKTTVCVDGIEFVKCEVLGQSFMLHQIRKMIGLAVAIMRNAAWKTRRKKRSEVSNMAASLTSVLLLIASLLLSSHFHGTQAQKLPPIVKGLSMSFYDKSCPKVESIVRKRLQKVFKDDIGQAAGLLRLHFHDCFVQGCDGSVLLKGSASGPSEQSAIPNLTLRAKAFEIIEDLRKRVHKECGRIVSCSDLVALAARDSVYLSGGPDYQVPLGRKDGIGFATSDATINNLVAPFANTTTVLARLAAKNLDATDAVALSGGHTIGISHCTSFTDRLYPSQDPTMDKTFANNLKRSCPTSDSNNTVVQDIRSPDKFDNKYYVDLMNRQGLFTSDQDLYTDRRTRGIVTDFAVNEALFFEKFVIAMIKMGQLSVLTGTQGEIRGDCSVRNSDNSFLSTVVEEVEEIGLSMF